MVRFTGVGARLGNKLVRAARRDMARQPNNATHSKGAIKPIRTNRRKKRFGNKVKSALVSLSEKKYKPNSINATTIDNGVGLVVDVSGTIPVGTSDITRIGDQIQTTSFEFNYILSVGDSYNTVRVLVWIWKQDTASVITDIIPFGNNTVAATLSPYNHDKRDQFHVIYDKLHVLNGYGLLPGTGPVPYTSNSNIASMNLLFKIPNSLRDCNYIGGGATGSNHLYIGFLSDSGTTPYPTVIYSYKLNFRDY